MIKSRMDAWKKKKKKKEGKVFFLASSQGERGKKKLSSETVEKKIGCRETGEGRESFLSFLTIYRGGMDRRSSPTPLRFRNALGWKEEIPPERGWS